MTPALGPLTVGPSNSMNCSRPSDRTPGAGRTDPSHPGKSGASTPGSPVTMMSPDLKSVGSFKASRFGSQSPEGTVLESTTSDSRMSLSKSAALLSESVTLRSSASGSGSSGSGSSGSGSSILSKAKLFLSREAARLELLRAKKRNLRSNLKTSLLAGAGDGGGSVGGWSPMMNLSVKFHDGTQGLVDEETRRLLESLPLPEKYLQRSVPELEAADRCEHVRLHKHLGTSSDSVRAPDGNRLPPWDAHPGGSAPEDGFFKGTQPSRNDSIPTAHVSPHSASARQVSSSLTYRSAPSDGAPGGLRRAVSSREFGSDSRFRSASPPADCSAVHEADVLAQKVQTARRWSSYQNLQTPEKAAAAAAADLAAGHDFVELCADTDPTLSESRFIQSEFPEHIYAGQQLQKQQRHLQDLSGAEGAPDIMQGRNLKYPGFQPAAGGSDLFPAHHGAVRREATGEAVTARFSYGGPEQRASYMNYVNGGVGGTATAYGPLQSTRHPAGMGGYNAGPPPAPPPPQPGGVVGVHRRLSASSTALYSNTSAQVDSGYGSLHHQVAPDFSSDITSWQQKHQEQLRRQNYEVTQTIRYPPTGMASGMLVSTNGIPTMVDPHKLDAIKRAADSIIREKDNIIEKQKVKIMHLEQQGKESDADLHKALYHKAQEEIDALRFKLQETEYDCASLKVQLTDVMKSKGSNMVDMECKLGKTEYELREFRISFEKEQQAWSVERKSMQEMISDKDLVVSEWKEKCLSQKAESDALERKMNSFDRYLNDLPTADDHSKKSLEVRLLKEEKAKYKARAVELDRRLEMANKVLKQKQEVLTEITSEAAETTNRLNTLQMESARLRAELSLREDDDLPAKKRELEELCSSNDRLTMDLEKARKLLEVKHKKLQVMEVNHLDEIRNLEERLARDESTVQGLKQELADKEAHLKKLRASVNELGSQNQDLLEKSMLLKEKQCELEMHISGEACKLEHRLLKEMSVCFAELQSLVQICIQRAEGQDPNISVLLGLKGVMNAEADDLPSTSDNVQSMQYKVIRIQALRQDIDNLREHISNKYAEDMGDNLNCATQ